MFVYKKLKASDAGITAFEAHKEYTTGSVYFGRYSSASKDSYSQFNLNNELEYFHLDNSFYKNPIFNIGNLNGGINYIDQEKRLYDKVAIVSIPQKQFGSAIQKGTITVDSTYIDDSKGNLYNSSDTLTDYPLDKERVLYVGPVKGFKRTDLTRNLKTGELLTNPPSEYSATQTDDSLYANPIIFNSSSIEHISDLNCTAIQLATGSVKIPHSSNFNFNDDDFTITFYYKSDNTTDKIIIDKSTSQPTVLAATDTTLGSQTTEEKVSSTPYEITVGSDITFKRTDIDGITSQLTRGTISADTLYHIACVKTGSNLKIYVDGVQEGANGTDDTNICRNKSDVLIGRTEDVEAQVSQLMIWNRGLSTTEIANVSESIDGSPYVGNVFYENGLITFTSPKVNNNFATVSSTTDNFNLLATDWIEGTTTTREVNFPTFNGEFTFVNSESSWYNFDYTDSSNRWIENLLPEAGGTSSPAPTLGTGPNTIKLYSPIYQSLYYNTPFNPLTSSLNHTYSTYSQLSGIFSSIPGSEGTSSGDLGTDNDSSASFFNPQSAGTHIGIFLAENQTVTESINVLFVSNSQQITEETFPLSDTSISDTIFSINDAVYTGVKYHNLINTDGFYLKANTPVGFESYPWWSGSLAMASSQTITDEDESDPISFAGGTINYTLPPGVIQGATYNDENTTYTNNPGTITIDAAPDGGFSYTDPLILRLTITGSLGFQNSLGDSLTTRIRFHENGYAVAEEVINNSFAPLSNNGATYTFSYPDSPTGGWTPEVGDDIFVTLEFDVTIGPGNPGSFPTATSGFIITHFGIVQGTTQSPYVNSLESRTTIDTKLSSIYHISCSQIAPNGLDPAGAQGAIDPYFASGYYGLNTDINGDTLGIKTLLWNRYNSAGNYTLITQSFYPSSSYTTALTNDFHYTYGPTDPENDEELFFQIVADTAENVIPNGTTISSLNNLTSWDYPIAKLPDSASMGISGSFTVTEVSGSDVLVLNTALSDHFTSSANLTSSILFGDTSSLLTNTSSSVDILGFIGGDGTKVQINGIYLATSSFNATASLDRGNFISSSASIDIAEDDYGMYFLDDLTIRYLGFGDEGYTSIEEGQQNVKVIAKVDGVQKAIRIGNTSLYYDTGGNVFSTPRELGVLNSSNNVSIEFQIVSSSDNSTLSPVVKNQGFYIDNINLRRITSSNELSKTDGTAFENTDLIDYISFFPNHGDDGNANLPFTDVPAEAEEGAGYVLSDITSFNGNNTIAYLDEYFFVTESITANELRQNGPFEVYHINTITTLVPGKEYDITWTGSITTEGDSISNEGTGIRITDNNGVILKEVFVDSGTTDASTLDLNYYRVDTNTPIRFNTFISGVASPLYPDGIVSSSITASVDLEITISAKSGSYFSNETIDPADFTVISGSEDWIYTWVGEGVNGDYTASTTAPTNLLHITSAHDSTITFNPVLDAGEFTLSGVQLTGNKLEVGSPLFITASSVISGTAPSTIEVLDSVIAVPVNPIPINVEPSSSWLGYTFNYVNPVDSETETLTVTAIDTDNNEITVNNGQGYYQIGTYADQDPQSVSLTYNTTTTSGGSVNFKNTHLIFENEFHCTVEPDEFNFTLNPTVRKYKSIERGELANFATGSNFRPYVTTIGLYNEEGELLVIGKLAQPVRTSEETDTTFVVRFDT